MRGNWINPSLHSFQLEGFDFCGELDGCYVAGLPGPKALSARVFRVTLMRMRSLAYPFLMFQRDGGTTDQTVEPVRGKGCALIDRVLVRTGEWSSPNLYMTVGHKVRTFFASLSVFTPTILSRCHR